MSEDREEPSGSIDSSDERRRPRRFAVKLRVLFQRSGVAHFIQAETHNISLGGVFIKTKRRPLEPGTRVSILIQRDAGELMLSARRRGPTPGAFGNVPVVGGIVRWVRDDVFARQEQGPRGMGVQFQDLDESKRRELQAFIDALHAPHP